MSVEAITIVTGASSNHFHCLRNLLYTIAYFEPEIAVAVYDLGLSTSEAQQLRQMGVQCRRFEFGNFPAHVDIKIQGGQYAWKPIITAEAVREFGGLVLWLDAGDLLTEPIDRIRRLLNQESFYSPTSAGTVGQWTHPATLKFLKATPDLLKKRNRSAGIVGFRSSHMGAFTLSQLWERCALIKACIAPEGSSRKNHRQDQAVLTVLAYQYQKKYGWKLEDRRLGITTHNDRLSISEVIKRIHRSQLAKLSPDIRKAPNHIRA